MNSKCKSRGIRGIITEVLVRRVRDGKGSGVSTFGPEDGSTASGARTSDGERGVDGEQCPMVKRGDEH